MIKNVVIFALSSSTAIAKEVVEHLEVELGNCEVKRFQDGEVLIEINESVRGKHVYIIQSTSSPANESIMELLIMIDALKRASAESINIVMPYFGYARQDRKAKARQPITARLVADMLQIAGASRVITFDLHAKQIQGFFTIPIDDMAALPLIARYIKKKKLKDICIVSPDHGGATRARELATKLNAPIAIIDKRRPKPNVAEIMNIVGEVEGKTCILIDDMIDTAGTICAGASALLEKGATSVYAAATHAILSGEAIERLDNSVIEEVIFTNTVQLSPEKHSDKFKIITVGKILAQVIDHIENIKPVSDVFNNVENDIKNY